MVRLATQNNPRFEISDIEIKRKGRSFLIDTLSQLKTIYPKAKLFFISGSDVSDTMSKWKSIDKILSLAKFILAKRPGYRLKKYNKDISVISITELDISSSMIRSKIKADKSIRYLIPLRVYRYIKQKGLYQ
jgi:nicotinate-nucleotide adenylyltransferase